MLGAFLEKYMRGETQLFLNMCFIAYNFVTYCSVNEPFAQFVLFSTLAMDG